MIRAIAPERTVQNVDYGLRNIEPFFGQSLFAQEPDKLPLRHECFLRNPPRRHRKQKVAPQRNRRIEQIGVKSVEGRIEPPFLQSREDFGSQLHDCLRQFGTVFWIKSCCQAVAEQEVIHAHRLHEFKPPIPHRCFIRQPRQIGIKPVCIQHIKAVAGPKRFDLIADFA